MYVLAINKVCEEHRSNMNLHFKDFRRFINLVLQKNDAIKINCNNFVYVELYDLAIKTVHKFLSRAKTITIGDAINIIKTVREFWQENQSLRDKSILRKNSETV